MAMVHEPTVPAGFEPGSVIAGKFRIERVLGAGAMGVVVQAWHLQLEDWVAIKFMLPAALGQRPLMIYAQVQSDKTVESIGEMRKEMRALVGDKPATADEIAKVKADQIRTLPGSYETIGAVASQVANMQRFGRPDDYIQTIKASNDPGGAGIDRIGPVSEAIVLWAGGVGVLMIAILWIGAKTQ